MATEHDALLDIVVSHLERNDIRFALIGAAALAIHGVSRSTLDIDLLITDRRVLDASFWIGLPESITRDIRPGDADDPLAGVVRLSASGQRDVDIVIGRGAWENGVLARADRILHQGHYLPAARVDDLILLKLYAGGSQDRWDIEQLLARPDRAAIAAAVEQSLGQLPPDARRLWQTLIV